MRWAFNITKDEPVLASEVRLVKEDRFICSECSLPVTYVNLKDGHFRHPLGIKDTSWECSLLSERTEHKNSTKNSKTVNALVERGTLTPEEALQALIHTVKHRDASLKEYQGLLSIQTSLALELKRKNNELNTELNTEQNTRQLPPVFDSTPQWTTYRHPSSLGDPVIRATWLDDKTHSKVVQLCKVPFRELNRRGDTVYDKIELSELEKSRQRVMMWIANPQTKLAQISLGHVSSLIQKELDTKESAGQIAAAIKNNKNERRQCVEHFLRIVVNNLYQTNTNLISKYNEVVKNNS